VAAAAPPYRSRRPTRSSMPGCRQRSATLAPHDGGTTLRRAPRHPVQGAERRYVSKPVSHRADLAEEEGFRVRGAVFGMRCALREGVSPSKVWCGFGEPFVKTDPWEKRAGGGAIR